MLEVHRLQAAADGELRQVTPSLRVEGWEPTLWWLIGEVEAEVSEEDHWSPPLEGLRVRALS